MTFILVLAVIALIAILAPVLGADSRDLAGPEFARDKLQHLRS